MNIRSNIILLNFIVHFVTLSCFQPDMYLELFTTYTKILVCLNTITFYQLANCKLATQMLDNQVPLPYKPCLHKKINDVIKLSSCCVIAEQNFP